MLVSAAGLAVLAVALAIPVPVALARASWPRRSPATALVLWQAIALAGGLSMIGALLCVGLAPWGDDLLSAAGAFVHAVLQPGATLAPLPHVLAITVAVLLGGQLLLNLVLTIGRVEAQRRRHRALVELLGTPDPDRPKTRLLDDDAPLAYCLPRATDSLTVLSQGLVRLLDDDELQAVVDHERAHVAQRHDLVLVAFRAWRTSLPWFPIASLAEAQVALLIEMLADDRARTRHADAVLARAIALVAGATPLGARRSLLGDAHPDELPRGAALARIERLELAPLARPVRAAVLGAAVSLVAVPTAWLAAEALLPLVA